MGSGHSEAAAAAAAAEATCARHRRLSTTPVSTTPSSCDTVVMQRCRVRLCVPHGGARHRARWCTQVRCRRPQHIMYGVNFGDGAIRLEMSTATYRARAALWQRSRGRAGQAHTLAAAHTRREQAVDGRTPLTLYLRLSWRRRWPARPGPHVRGVPFRCRGANRRGPKHH